MSTDFLKIAQAHVASTGADPRIVIGEMEVELEKVAFTGLGRMAAKAVQGVGNLGTRLGASLGRGVKSTTGFAGKATAAIKKPFQNVSKGYRSQMAGISTGQQGARDTMRRAMPAPPKATPTLEGLNPGSKKVNTQPGIPEPKKSGTAPGASPDLADPNVTGKKTTEIANAQAEGGPGFMQQNFGLTPGHDQGMLQGQGVGDWWKNLGKTNPNAQLKVMGAAGAGAAGAGYMLGGSGGGRTQVIYS